MANIAVVYWSGTGNTESMANAMMEHLAEGGHSASLIPVASFSVEQVGDYENFIFGCSASGAETLEESEFLPVWEAVKGELANKSVALFGSYGWGDGEFMQTWQDDCADSDIEVVGTVICSGEPDEEIIEACKALTSKF